MWYVYILICSDLSLYTGSSDDVDRRFRTHQAGKGAKYTRSHKPVKVVFTEKFATKSEALKRESQIKKWSRKKKIDTLHLVI